MSVLKRKDIIIHAKNSQLNWYTVSQATNNNENAHAQCSAIMTGRER